MGSYVRWDSLLSGFSWCDYRLGFLLDTATGELVGCYEGDLLQVPLSTLVNLDPPTAPRGFSASECAGSLAEWQTDPAAWFRSRLKLHGALAG